MQSLLAFKVPRDCLKVCSASALKRTFAHGVDAYLPVLLARELFVDDEKTWEHFVRCGHCCFSSLLACKCHRKSTCQPAEDDVAITRHRAHHCLVGACLRTVQSLVAGGTEAA